MMLKLKFLGRLLIFSSKTIYLICSLGIITLVNYFFDYGLLRQPLNGNDAGNSYQFITWINNFWPHVPVWYPLQGAGASFVQGYPTLYHYTVVLVSRLTNLNLVQSMAALNFLSVLLTAFGIYFLVAWRFKNLTAAFVASIFLLVSPMVYIWIDGAGFLAQTFSFIFVAPAIAFYDAFLVSNLSGDRGWKRALLLVGLILVLVLATLAHPATTIGLFVTFALYTVLVALLEKNPLTLGKRLFRSFLALLSVGVVWLLAVAFWFIPFYRYTAIANRGFNFLSTDPKTFAQVDFLPTLGFYKTGYAYNDLSIVMVVTFFIIIALFLSYFHSKRAFIFTILAIWNLFLMGSMTLVALLTKFAPQLVQFIDLRTAVPIALVLAPVSAALGASFIFETIFALIARVFKFFIRIKLDFVALIFRHLLKPISVAVFTLVLVLAALYFFNDKTAFATTKRAIYYGPWVRGISLGHPWVRNGKPTQNRCEGNDRSPLCNYPAVVENLDIDTFSFFCGYYSSDPSLYWMCKGDKGGGSISKEDVQEFIARCNLANLPISMQDLCLARFTNLKEKYNPLHWPKVYLADSESFTKAALDLSQHFKSLLGEDVKRIDIAPSFGSQVKIFGLQRDISIVNIYTGQLILSKPFSGLLRQVLSSKGEIINGRLDEVAKWFGLEGVYLNSTDPQEVYQNSSWKSYQIGGGVVWQPPKSFGVASVGEKPAALLIGSSQRGSYEQVFKVALAGVPPYDRYWLVEGKEKIDAYSLSDLKNYQVLILHGYSYKNKNKAWGLLKDYVSAGGSVFIDTGWQFATPDWGGGDSKKGYRQYAMPEPSPVSKTTWANIGPSWDGVEFESSITGKLNLDKFAPLTLQGANWWMSLANREDLRSDAKPILTKNDQVIMAAWQYGKGKIIWSGMNFFSHVVDSNQTEEYKLLKKSFDWLSSDLPKSSEQKLTFERSNPDRVTFELPAENQTRYIYWKEFYYPDWQARLEIGDQVKPLPVWRAGAEMVLIKIPPSSSNVKVIYEYKEPLVYKIASILSVITLIGLFIYLIDNLLLKGFFSQKIFRPFNILLERAFFGRIKRIREVFSEEDEQI